MSEIQTFGFRTSTVVELKIFKLCFSNWRQDGGFNRSFNSSPHHLRHVQGRQQEHGHWQHQTCSKDRRKK